MHAEIKTELLAPAGKWSILKEVVKAGADAVYLGGKRFNMRLLRPDFNFTDQEIRDAAAWCHDRGVSLYVTLNNLYQEQELPELNDYLNFLKDVMVDAVIIQDLALIEPSRRLGIPVHASVQMGVGNRETVQILEESGVSRVILSKNLTLHEIGEIRNASNLGLEYFVHGDLCVAHAGQCLMSGLLFGESGNRGQCRKPCRWRYRLEGSWPGAASEYKYLLAYKDLCLYLHIPELIDAGISSFKIEGRMRQAEYLAPLVSSYRKAIDRYLSGSGCPATADPEWTGLYDRRIREFTSGSLQGPPGLNDIGVSGSREPAIATGPLNLSPQQKADYIPGNTVKARTDLSGKVDSPENMRMAMDKGVQTVVIPGTPFRNHPALRSFKDIVSLVEAADPGIRVVLEFPRIVAVRDHQWVNQLWSLVQTGRVDEVMVHDPGSLYTASRLGVAAGAGCGFNLANSQAVKQIKAWGGRWACPSLEIGRAELQEMMGNSPLPLEIMVHGPLVGMISDYCVVGSISGAGQQECLSPCAADHYFLVDELGQRYPLRCDHRCRCHIYHPMERSLFTELPWLAVKAGRVRIEANGYPPKLLGQVIDIYQKALRGIEEGEWNQESGYYRLLDLFPEGLTKGAFDVAGNAAENFK